MFVASPQQAAFIDWAVNGRGSCVLEAVAGAGKTTTILEAVDRMRGQSAILAYNKKIAEEIKGKLVKRGIDWKRAEAGTVHSFGFRAYRKAFPKVQVRETKVADIMQADLDAGRVPESVRPYTETVCRLVGLAKQRAIGVLSPIARRADWEDIIEHFDMIDDTEGKACPITALVNAAIALLQRSNAQTDVIDFDDMVYLPLLLKVRFWQVDNVFVDEAQDTNPARRALVRALVKPASRGGRVIAVGDSHQAIYGFTGADSDSLDLIGQEFDAVRMPLTVTYRCPKAIVSYARKWVSHIEAHESAPDGSVSDIAFEVFVARKDLDADSAILCRNTKPLVKAAFALIRKRIPCRIEGREVGRGLTKLATRWKGIKTLAALEEKLSAYAIRQTELLTAKKKETKAQEIQDQVDTLCVIIDQARSEGKTMVADAVAYIESIFADGVTGMLTLSTIHKSKGREWERVFWLDRANTCPSKAARQTWEMEQEMNLCYVAATRAKAELYNLAPAVETTIKAPVAARQSELALA